MADFEDEIVQILETAVKFTQPREDYRVPGAVPPRGIDFAAPGAMHQTRWMSKVIYMFKVSMFLSHFKLTAREHRSLRELSIFFSSIYVEAWVTTSIALKALRNDLKLLKQCQMYHMINKINVTGRPTVVWGVGRFRHCLMTI